MKETHVRYTRQMRIKETRLSPFFLSAIILLLIMNVGCSKEEDDVTEPPIVDVTSIKLSQTSVTLSPGETIELTATVLPENVADKSVTWSSSNSRVATVSNGTVTAVAIGSATITAQSGNIKEECSVVVNPYFVETAAGLNMKMIYVEGGEFMMGATSEQSSDAFDSELPVRRVRLDSYYICECEVTQEQWETVMGTTVVEQAVKAGYEYLELYGIGPDYPMYYVSWVEAKAFCQELSRMTGRTYSLPTEAQWEYAARCGKKTDGSKYSGGNSIDDVAWYWDNSGDTAHPVKTKRPNALGLYDMSGSVLEWCYDWYSSSYNANDTDNPTGPSTGVERVLRGGSWFTRARYCRVSHRSYETPDFGDYDYGFRVVVIP